jgi:site-specific recombinase XerD
MSKRTLNYNLERPKDRNVWFVVVDVPPSLRALVGSKRLRKTTGTSDIHLARLRRLTILSDLKARIEAARKVDPNNPESNIMAKALEWRKEIEGTLDPAKRDDLRFLAVDAAEAIEKAEGFEAAKSFHDVATGKGTPLNLFLEEWLQEKRYGARQAADYRRFVERLGEWLRGAGLVETLETVTDRVASAFKSKSLMAAGLNPKTANKIMSGLRSYWTWLGRQGHSAHNPWLGKSLPKLEVPQDEKERAFTDNEIQLLLSGKPDQTLSDAMMISALSGMRLDEIFQLKVKHCTQGVFKVSHGTTGKTKAAERLVPIHTGLKAIIKRLSAGQDDEAYIMAEESAGWGKSRSMAVSKRFATYRRGMGVDEMIEGKRRSLVNFHSFRRWFITKADQAGCRKEDIERVVGHKVQGMSLGLYSSGMTLEQAREVVQSVMMPVTKKITPKTKTGSK